jgi:hypothetical protein
MNTFVISTPSTKSGPPGYRSFANTLEYGIFSGLLGQLSPGMRVIVIDKPGGRQAEGKLITWNLKYVDNGVGHYDVVMQGLQVVPFQGGSIPLNRRGVAII